MRRDGVGDLHGGLVLSEVLLKLPVGRHQVHDDGVVHLRAARGVESDQKRGLVCVCYCDHASEVWTHDVVVVFVLWSLAVVNSVGSGDLLDAVLGPRQADQLRGKLWNKQHM